MVFNQIDEEETRLQDRTEFEEFQNALHCVIASFVEYPQVTKTSSVLLRFASLHSNANQSIVKFLIVCFDRLKFKQ